MKYLVSIVAFMLLHSFLFSQNLTQTVRGTVIDNDSKIPLIGAQVMIQTPQKVYGAMSDIDGSFKIIDVPIGRQNINISYLGYEPQTMSSVMVTSGKELVLEIPLIESVEALEEVVILDRASITEALNDMATVSARTFSVEESARYAASAFDPARMAQNFAGVGVGTGSSDLFNEIVIRGNSPKGLLWRLEGIEIVSPNHFGELGGGGGAISMLSSSTLNSSDFFTGAFPAEYGNAMSGVFDLRLRNGNNQKREYAVMLGALGLEASAEGPFRKGGKASYLVNYRYSTLAALEAVGLNPAGDVLPAYRDYSFKLNFPTENAGTFGIFGLGGGSDASFDPEPDSLTWADNEDGEWGFLEQQKRQIYGASHNILLKKGSYLKTVVAMTHFSEKDTEYYLDKEQNYKQIDDYRDYSYEDSYRITTQYNRKINAKNQLRTGLIYSGLGFGLELEENDEGTFRTLFDNDKKSAMFQGYAQWQHRPTDRLTFNTGVHYTQFLLNNAKAVEPRLGMRYRVNKNQALNVGLGLHSRMENLGVYTIEGEFLDGYTIKANKDLELTKAAHAVLGYDVRLSRNLRLKAEAYYQYLYDVPVQDSLGSTASSLSASAPVQLVVAGSLSNEGIGRNVGVDLTLEKSFSNNYYFLVTGSIFDSKYAMQKDGDWYNTPFNGGYNMTTLGGKEWKVGKRKKNILGINGKYVMSGGTRHTPVDLAASIAADEEVRFDDNPYGARSGKYYRFDLGFSYRMNFGGSTHTIMLDVQNITNRLNIYAPYYDEDTMKMDNYVQTGLFPFFNYRVEF